MDLIVLSALKRCEEVLSQAIRVELTEAGWETIEFDARQGTPLPDSARHPEGQGPDWKGKAGTYPLLPLLRKAIERVEHG